jgi:hypothetical protein
MAVLGSTSLTGCNSIPDFIAGGSLMLFQQTTAPTNWTKGTTHNNKALRVVTGTATPGGSTAFTTVFASRTVLGLCLCLVVVLEITHSPHLRFHLTITRRAASIAPMQQVQTLTALSQTEYKPALVVSERRCSLSPILCWFCIIFRKRTWTLQFNMWI